MAKLKTKLYMGFWATLNCRKFKVVLNLMFRIYLTFAKSYVLSDLLIKILFLVFIWRTHSLKLNFTFPFQVLVSSDNKPYSNLTFQNVSTPQGSAYCNRALLNFQTFALRDMNIATREGCRVGQNMSFC